MTHPNGAAADLVARASSRLHTHRIGRAIRAFDVVGSTNELAIKWAEEGAPDGAVVYAELQKQGRGRMGRPWVARGGINLTFSIVLRPSLPTDRWGMITIAAGVAV
ncbi:MAG: biotin--[acetyl-CoA-carboxylase] ligase, partial [Rhodothermales bacterium]